MHHWVNGLRDLQHAPAMIPSPPAPSPTNRVSYSYALVAATRRKTHNQHKPERIAPNRCVYALYELYGLHEVWQMSGKEFTPRSDRGRVVAHKPAVCAKKMP